MAMSKLENYVDDTILAAISLNTVCTAAVINYYIKLLKVKTSQRKKRVWVCKYLVLREQYGAYSCLMHDLLELDDVKFCNYIRMDPDVFEQLFAKVEHLISNRDTRLR